MKIIATNRNDALVDGNGQPSLRFADVIESLVDKVNTLTDNTEPYAVANGMTDRSLDASQAEGSISSPPTQAEVENLRDAVLDLANVVSTLIADLKNAEIIQ